MRTDVAERDERWEEGGAGDGSDGWERMGGTKRVWRDGEGEKRGGRLASILYSSALKRLLRYAVCSSARLSLVHTRSLS